MKLAKDELRYMTGNLFMHSRFLENLEKLKLYAKYSKLTLVLM